MLWIVVVRLCPRYLTLAKQMDEIYERLLQEASGDNPEAFRFLIAWSNYCHAVDDIIDSDIRDSEGILNVFVMAQEIYGSNFYLSNFDRLFHSIRVVTSSYADSVSMARSTELWQREEANIIRSCGNDIILLVASITGGYGVMRKIAFQLRKHSYEKQRKDQTINL